MHTPSPEQWNVGLQIFVCTVGQQAVASVPWAAAALCGRLLLYVCVQHEGPEGTNCDPKSARGGLLQLECSGVSAIPPPLPPFPPPAIKYWPVYQNTDLVSSMTPAPRPRFSAVPPEHNVTGRPHPLWAAFHLSWLHERLGEIYHVQVVNLL